MINELNMAEIAAGVIQDKTQGFTPKVAYILGSGLGNFAEQVRGLDGDNSRPFVIPYAEVPGFLTCSVPGHQGQLYLGLLQGVPVVCLQGRTHLYEGASLQVLRVSIKALKLLGCETLIVTNAAGSLREDIQPGQLMCVSDHINFTFHSPLVGELDCQEFGSRFVSLENAYDAHLRQDVQRVANELKIALKEGVYMGLLGPNFETPAEIRAFRMLGADAVGMSTVPEVIIARYCQMKVMVLSVITNMAAGFSTETLSHEQTIRVAGEAAEQLSRLLSGFTDKILKPKFGRS